MNQIKALELSYRQAKIVISPSDLETFILECEFVYK